MLGDMVIILRVLFSDVEEKKNNLLFQVMC